jgi:predicted transcriptional regulator
MGYFLIRNLQRGRCLVSWYLQNQVDQNAGAGLYKSIYETAVMRALASFANDDGGSCFPSLATLAARSQCSQSTVRRVLQQFKKRKWIAIKHTGRSNIYQISPHGCVEPKAVQAAFGRRVITENPEEPSNSRVRMVSETIQNSQPDQSECSLRPIRTVSGANDSHQLPSSKNPHHINSLSLTRESGAGAPEREKECSAFEDFEEVTEEEETQSFVTQSENTSGGLPHVPSATRGDSQGQTTAQGCVCDSKHPPGMPTLREICFEMRKLRQPDEESEKADVMQEAYELHDVWLSIGFRTKSGPIHDWKAALRNWMRWRANGGADVFG